MVACRTKRSSQPVNSYRITLTDGRLAEWHEWGESINPRAVILYCHGTPGSGLESEVFERQALAEKILVISPDRPGLGGSTFLRDRTVENWAEDAAQILEYKGIAQCMVLGYSGGTPHALAFAALFPLKVEALGLIAPFTHDDGFSARLEQILVPVTTKIQQFLYKNLRFSASQYVLGVLGCALSWLFPTSPIEENKQDQGRGRWWDADLLRALGQRSETSSYLENMVRSHSYAFRQNSHGAVQDFKAIYGSWPMPTQNSVRTIPTVVWLGERDQVINRAGARELSTELQALFRTFPQRGHTSLFALHADDILKDLADLPHD